MTWTLLHDAAEHHDASAVLSRSRSMSFEEALEVDDHGCTPLHIASSCDPSLQILKALVEANPCAVLSRDTNGDTPLHVLLQNPIDKKSSTYMDAARYMMEACPDVLEVSNRDGFLPMHVACRFCPNKEVVRMLVQAYPPALRKRTKKGDPAPARVRSKSAGHHHDIVDGRSRPGPSASDTRFLFRSHNRPSRDGTYPLHVALSNHASKSSIEILIEAAPDVLLLRDKYGRTPLHIAAAEDVPKEIIETLLSADATPLRIADKRGNLPLHAAYEHRCGEDVIELLRGAYPSATHIKNDDGRTPSAMTLDGDVAMGGSRAAAGTFSVVA